MVFLVLIKLSNATHEFSNSTFIKSGAILQAIFIQLSILGQNLRRGSLVSFF